MPELIIAGQTFAVDAPVVNFTQAPYWDATTERCVGSDKCLGGVFPFGHDVKNQRARRYSYRSALRRYQAHPPLQAVRAVIRQFVVHHDGCEDAAACWHVLHNERGLSCHFIVDNDGTIYQTLDLAYNGYHAAEFNPHSIGVEISSRGDALRDPDYYKRRGQARDVRPAKIHGHTYLAFDFTPAQYLAMLALAKALVRLLPNLPVEYPQDLPGHQALTVMEGGLGYSGYLGHYHATTRKWDPGPFDFKSFCDKIRGSLCFPVSTGKVSPGAGAAGPTDPASTTRAADELAADPERVLVPTEYSEAKVQLDALYAANERLAEGGYYPLGPWGESRLWHGGVHLAVPHKRGVFSPFAGRIVAARVGGTSAVGSTDFVLVAHRCAFGPKLLRFYGLYMHLANVLEVAPQSRPGWAQRHEDKLRPGEVILLDEPVEAGARLGRVGMAGPGGYERAQLHLEFFASQELPLGQSGYWRVIDGTSGGRFCDVGELLAAVDRDADERLSREELADAVSADGEQDVLRWLVALHTSEWTFEPDWLQTLRQPKDFRDVDPKALEERVREEITPGLWWDERVARHAGLPRDGVVYHYHPVTFLAVLAKQLADGAAVPLTQADAKDAAQTPEGVTDDLGDTSGASAVSDADLRDDDPYQDLTLEEIASGYDALKD